MINVVGYWLSGIGIVYVRKAFGGSICIQDGCATGAFVELNQEDLFGTLCSGNSAGFVADYFVVSLSVNFYSGAENAVNNQGPFCSNGNDRSCVAQRGRAGYIGGYQ